MLTKVCITCKVEKDTTDFYFKEKNKLSSYCKKCFNVRSRERRKRKMELSPDYRKIQSDKRYARMKRRMESDPEYKSMIITKNKKQVKNRLKIDPLYRFRKMLSRSIRGLFKKNGYSKPCKTSEILGIDDDGFIKYIEGLFQDGMTWGNRGEWDVDHIVPASLGNTIDEIKYLNHYTNLRPLWKDENLKKSNLIDDSNIELYNKFLKEMRNGM